MWERMACSARSGDFLRSLPAGAQEVLRAQAILEPASRVLPFFSQGMGWVIPACLGLVVGLALHVLSPKKAA